MFSSSAALFGSLLFGAIRLGAFMYRKKMVLNKPMGIGFVLMAFPSKRLPSISTDEPTRENPAGEPIGDCSDSGVERTLNVSADDAGETSQTPPPCKVIGMGDGQDPRRRPSWKLSRRSLALILHGNGDSVLSMAALTDANRPMLAPRLAALLPDMPIHMRADLLPLLLGNLDHVAEVRVQAARHERELDIEHREWKICLGRGFDFLHTPNIALIVGPYSPNLDGPVRTAAAIIRENMRAGHIPDDGFLLLASVPYDDISVDRARAELKAGFLSRFAAEVIGVAFPDLAPRMFQRTAVLDWSSRRLEEI